MTGQFAIKKVAVIGTGACGLPFVKALLAENVFASVTVFERNKNAGGLWNYTDTLDGPPSVPSKDPKPVVAPVADKSGAPLWPSAAYDGLTTNVPWEIMTYDCPTAPKDVPLFAHRSQVVDFLEAYAADISSNIRYNTNVTDLRKRDGVWTIEYDDLVAGTSGSDSFDAVVVASGYFYLPFIPSQPGVDEWAERYAGSVVHAKNYRRPDAFADKTVLVVGNSASGLDIANQIAGISSAPVYVSARSPTVAPGAYDPTVRHVGEIVKLDVDARVAYFKDGTSLEHVDHILYATGYLRSIPFIRELNAGPYPVITNGFYVDNLYEQLIYIPDPTIVFPGAPRFVLPFRVAESQACYLARVWANRLSLPPAPIMWLNYFRRLDAITDLKTFHDIKFPQDVDFCEFFYQLCELAPGGMMPRRWTRETRAFRGAISELKTGFQAYKREHGVPAPNMAALLEGGYCEPISQDVTDPDFTDFGKVLNGDSYSAEDVSAAEEEVAELTRAAVAAGKIALKGR
ncbi:uncharacterized protein V1510DRAFT_404253 [Dipodascopsis tothii]|uniref:uncharacterized protein n=1 Tax=Dipodascopsis tothii TaxID=44089 RepID=UPI0034CEA8B0